MPLANRQMVTVKHLQETPSLEWLIAHGQHGYPLVDAYISYEDVVQKIIPKEVQYVDENTVRLVFNSPRAGFATVIV